MRIPFAVLAVAASLLAGCADPASPTDDAPAAAVGPSSMSIIGLVQDEAFNGVGGAHVALRLFNQTTATDATGAFRFDGLPLSAYLVDVNATGFEPATLTAEPSADGNSSLNFVLLRATSLRPRIEVTHVKGIFECAFEAVIIPGSCDTVSTTFGGPGVFNDTSVFQVGLGRNWHSIVIDVDFEPENSPGLEGLRLVVRGVNDADKLNEYQQYGRFSGGTPFTARMDVNGSYDDGTAPVPGNITLAELVMYPQGHGYHATCGVEGGCALGVGAGTDVQFDLYVTVFYNQMAPEGYTLLQS